MAPKGRPARLAAAAAGAVSRAAFPVASRATLGEQRRPAVSSVLVLTLLTGGAFPLLLFAIARSGTLPSDTLTFAALVFGTILLGGALCFLPALALGPIVEYLGQ